MKLFICWLDVKVSDPKLMLNVNIFFPNKLGCKHSISSFKALLGALLGVLLGPPTNPAKLAKDKSGCEIYKMTAVIGQSGIHFR